MGDRIMDDAHKDMVADREVTQESFKYAVLIAVFLFALDPPESVVGASLVSLVALTPLVTTLLNRSSTPPPPDSTGDKH